MMLLLRKLAEGRGLLQRLTLSAEQQRWVAEYVDGTLLLVLAGVIGSVGLATAGLYVYRTRARVAALAGNSQLNAALAQMAASEAAVHRSLGQLSMASEHLSVWELDLRNDELRSTEGTDFSHRLGVSKCGGNEFVERFVHPDDRPALIAAYKQHLPKSSGTSRFTHRYRLLHAAGGIRHMQFHARIMRDADGTATLVLGVDVDVTFEVQAAHELEQQAEQLRAAERRLERASRSSLEGHWETDMVTGRTWMSSTLLALLGYDESMQVVEWRDFAARMVHPDDLPMYNRALSAHLKHGTQYDVRVRFLRGDGSGRYQWTAVHGALERDADGKLLRMAGSSRDVHEQQLAQLELSAMQARFERAIRGTRDGLFDLDLKTQRFWVSPRLWEIIGHDPAHMPREIDDHYAYVHPEDVVLLEEALRVHCDLGVPYDIEYRVRHCSGEWLWVRSRAIAERDANGVALRLSGSVHDISEARAARDALIKATQEAEAANRAKSTFLATMSHEIRTPMNGLIGMTNLLLDTPLERTQREYAETIRASSDSLLGIINDVLDFSKIEAGKLQVELIEMSVSSLVDDVASVMALQAVGKGVELIVDVHAEVPDRVRGDAQRIRQCLSNLLGNAVKFTATGEIVMQVSQRIGPEGRAMTHFSVRDTGIGMDRETAARLFQPFVQADSSTTRKFGGTGLGLSIVKRLVEVMGGQVGIESEVGRGSTFWFSLPLQAVVQPGASVVAVLRDPNRALPRVLIADDNTCQRGVIAKQVARAGCECESVATADAAVAALHQAFLEQRPFDAVLIDHQLGSTDGELLGRDIRGNPHHAAIRLVMLTTVEGSADRKRFEELGFAACLIKPLRSGELDACLRSVLAGPQRNAHAPVRTHLPQARATYRAHVLLVEDNVVNQKVAQKFVERLGCSVQIAPNGADAVALYASQQFDLILMDMEMPVLDGMAATRRIREMEVTMGRRTPIVALTANALSEQMEHCLLAGMDAFLSKPIEPEKLQQTVARFLSPPADGAVPESVAANAVHGMRA